MAAMVSHHHRWRGSNHKNNHRRLLCRCRCVGYLVLGILAMLFLAVLVVQEGSPQTKQHQQHSYHDTVPPTQEQQHHEEKQATTTRTHIVYVGKFGLGHRLSKMAAAYHLGQRLLLAADATNSTQSSPPSHMQVQWGVCRNEGSDTGGAIFDVLFGTHQIPFGMVDFEEFNQDNDSTSKIETQKEIWIRNDCHGYYAGQNFKNARQAIPKYYTQDSRSTSDSNIILQQQQSSPFFQKMDSDVQLFLWLQDRFVRRHFEPRDFMAQHAFPNHTVIGLHIRAGNGETEHFVQANRAVNLDEFLTNLTQLLQTFWDAYTQQPQQYTIHTVKPPLLFVATDTPTVIPRIRQALEAQIRVVSFEQQPILPPSGGVTYSQVKTGQTCLWAWKAMMIDTILLSHADILVAGMRSSFTQIMPLAMVLNNNHNHNGNHHHHHQRMNGESSRHNVIAPRFCEVSESGRTMTCVEDRQSWLFRDVSKEWTLSIDEDNVSPPSARVVHKVMVHFPDVDEEDFRLAADWKELQSFVFDDNKDVESTTTIIMNWGGNGKTFNSKYRKKSKGMNFTSEWTFS